MSILLLAQIVALQGATVHSMVPGAEPEVATVLIEDGRFSAIGTDLEIPPKAEVIDLSGMHLLPGLIDGMVHHDMEHDALYVLGGVTLARDMGNELETILLAALPNVRERIPGPDLWVSGSIFDGVPPATTESVIVRSAEEVDGKISRLVERGIQFASFHTGIPANAWRRLIASSHGLDLQVWGPIPAAASLEEVLTSGQDGLAYLEGFQQPGAELDRELAHDLVMAYARNGVAAMPLLHVYGYRTEDQGDDPPIFNYLAPYYADWWRADLNGRRALFNADYLQEGAARYAQLEWLVHDLWESGVALLPGSAAPNPWMAPGEGLHDELEAWVAAGIPAPEVLRLATVAAAETLGLASDYGTIEVGKVASALVVDADPGTDLGLLRAPKGVLLRGRWLSETFLTNLRGALRQAQLQATARAEGPVVIDKPTLPEGRVVLEGRVEGAAFDRVVAAEEYWVVRCFDGDTAWVARMVLSGSLNRDSTRSTITQRYRDKKLNSFELEVVSGRSTYRVEGMEIGGQFRLKRWMNDQYIDTNSTPSGPMLVDAGMALPAMIMSHYRKDGLCSALYFEGMDPIVTNWELNRGENGVLAIKTGQGPMVATIEANGALDKLGRIEGKANVRYESVRSDSFGGPGMPPRPYEPAPSSSGPETDPGPGGGE